MEIKIRFRKPGFHGVGKLIIVAFAFLLTLPVISLLNANAASTANVTATVTAQNISVSVSDGTVAYSTMGTSATKSTAINDGDALSDTQTVTNDGNVTETINIMGVDTDWELGDTVGVDQYTHGFCITDCDDGTPVFTPFNEDGYTQVTTGVAGDSVGTVALDLQIGTPTSTATYTQQSVTVTVQGVGE